MSNNLKQIGLGLHNFADTNDSFAFAITDGTSNTAVGGRDVKMFSRSDGEPDFRDLRAPETPTNFQAENSTIYYVLDASGDLPEPAAGSAHTDGAQFLFADGSVHFAMGDGSVRFISESIDLF